MSKIDQSINIDKILDTLPDKAIQHEDSIDNDAEYDVDYVKTLRFTLILLKLCCSDLEASTKELKIYEMKYLFFTKKCFWLC